MIKMADNQYQKGVVLIFVMMIFALIAAISTSVLVMTRVNVGRQGAYLHHQQAKYYALGAEQYVAMLLQSDHKTNPSNRNDTQNTIDHWFSDWADDHDIKVDDGHLTVQVIDEQALFNLNRLSASDSDAASQELAIGLGKLGIDSALIKRILDWKTEEADALETIDIFYATLDPPLRIRGGPLISTSELNLMQILNPTQYKKLRPYITVLPGQTKWNLNTVPRELLAIIFAQLNENEIEELIQTRGKTGFSQLSDLKNHSVFSDKQINWDNLNVALSSQYFSVYTKAVYGDATYYLHSVLYRNHKGNVSVIQREEGEYPAWVSVLRRSMREL